MPKNIPLAVKNLIEYLNSKEADLTLSPNFFYLKDDKGELYKEKDARCFLTSLKDRISDVDFFQEDSYYVITYFLKNDKYVMKARFDELDLIDSLSIEKYDKMKEKCVLFLEYDGTDYYGMQKQQSMECPTIQGEIELALKRMLKRDIETTISSRTDRGVHARSNCIQFDSNGIDAGRYMYALNNLLPQSIRIKDAKIKSQLHNVRYDVVSKEYSYIIDTNEFSTFRRNYCLYHRINDVERMKRELESIKGTHDFISFCKGENDDTTRTIYDVSIDEKCGIYTFRFKGDGFLHNMIRLIMGMLLYIDEGHDMTLKGIMESKDKNLSSRIAPSSGLYLERINYRRTFK